MAAPDQWYGKSLQLHGFVVKGSILRKRETLDYGSRSRATAPIVPATYRGIVPDTFKYGRGSRDQGHAGAEWIRRRAQRRDGEVSVQVRSLGRRRRAKAAPGAAKPPARTDTDGLTPPPSTLAQTTTHHSARPRGRSDQHYVQPRHVRAARLVRRRRYAATVSVVGARRRSHALVESGVGAFYAVAALLTSPPPSSSTRSSATTTRSGT